MNFLAHAYLSGNSEEILVGNFIADALKGNQYKHFSEDIIKGILLHRKIDEYTDSHPVVNASKQRLRPRYSKYASVIVDIYYDHFLAVNWRDYSDVSLESFAEYTYGVIDKYYDQLPEEVHHFFPYMKRSNWLVNYANDEGLTKVFLGMSKRASFVSGMENAPQDLKKDYALYEAEFRDFFPQLVEYTSAIIKNQT
jgi:acyl carrier protein phosphodiesterase